MYIFMKYLVIIILRVHDTFFYSFVRRIEFILLGSSH